MMAHLIHATYRKVSMIASNFEIYAKLMKIKKKHQQQKFTFTLVTVQMRFGPFHFVRLRDRCTQKAPLKAAVTKVNDTSNIFTSLCHLFHYNILTIA